METHTATSTPAKGKTPEKPVMAAKKEFTLPPFTIVDEVPVPTRVNTQARLPIGFDELFAAATDKANKGKAVMRFIPVALWESRGIEADAITPAKNKDRLRRAFYGWQGKDAAKLRYTLAFSDQVDSKQKHTGTNLYVVLKPPAA